MLKNDEFVYQSRATILDRPAWRDDQVKLGGMFASDEYTMSVVGVKNSSEEAVYDEVPIPNIIAMGLQSVFLASSTHEIEVKSARSGNTYQLKYSWNIGKVNHHLSQLKQNSIIVMSWSCPKRSNISTRRSLD